MKKTLIALGALALCLALTQAGNASTDKNVTSGTCYNGAKWTLTMSRSGSKVTAAVTAAPMTERKSWNVNFAWTPINRVSNFTAKTDSKGRLSFSQTAISSAPVTVFVWIDYPYALAMTCAIGGTL